MNTPHGNLSSENGKRICFSTFLPFNLNKGVSYLGVKQLSNSLFGSYCTLALVQSFPLF